MGNSFIVGVRQVFGATPHADCLRRKIFKNQPLSFAGARDHAS